MTRWPLLASFVLFIALCASLAAWTVQSLKPAARVAIAPPAQESTVTVQLATAATLFGSRKPSAAPVGDYALKGVIVMPSADNGVAIIAIGSKPAQAVRVGADIEPGVSVKEVHRQFVVLSERGAERRLQLFGKKAGETLAQFDTPARGAAGETRPQPTNASTSSEAPRPVQPRSRRGRAENSAARSPAD